jgi:hypothetical protein
MIRYALACDEGHAFESWFANSATYDRQVKRGLVSCPVCNSTKVEKAVMAPRVAGTKRRGDASVSVPMPEGPASSQPSASKAPPGTSQTNVRAPVAMMSPQEREFRGKLKELREHLIRNADYVWWAGRRSVEADARRARPRRVPRCWDSTLVAWYPSLYAPRTGGAHDSHHWTAGIAGRSRRRGCLAARGARAAAGEATDYRVPGRGSYGVECIHHGFCGATACARLDRGSYHRDRVSLVGRTPGARH